MTDIHEFSGTVLDDTSLMLGEGPTFDPSTGTVWWFNILGKQLHELHVATNTKTVHALPFMASVLARIDDDRQLIASEEGLFIRDKATGDLSLHLEFEPNKPGNRSNDGRVHPSGALWIGTMGKKAEEGAGAIYHVAKGVVTTLYDKVSIPNAICFSQDGATGYFVDTKVNMLMKVALDAETGLPTGEPVVLVDRSGLDGGIDGAVCDAEGHIWNACWGEGAVDHYAPDGRHLARYKVPAAQTTCPAFFGADRILVTSAREGLDDATVAANPAYGKTFDLGITVKGVFDAAYRL
jgi:sugar lactone lactonase YvrE